LTLQPQQPADFNVQDGPHLLIPAAFEQEINAAAVVIQAVPQSCKLRGQQLPA
jgi:hypothetical protein